MMTFYKLWCLLCLVILVQVLTHFPTQCYGFTTTSLPPPLYYSTHSSLSTTACSSPPAIVPGTLLNLETTPPSATTTSSSSRRRPKKVTMMMMMMTQQEQELALWMTTFSTSHIGMSAIRDKLIMSCGTVATTLGLVNNPNWKLPDYWLGDSVDQNDIFPTAETAGRQLYRMGYTAVSFLTLGGALSTYFSIISTSSSSESSSSLMEPILSSLLSLDDPSSSSTINLSKICFAIASTSFAASIASLFNASPLGLMPSFEATATTTAGGGGGGRGGGDNNDDENVSLALLPVQRNDILKLTPRGLTRITRHPLILPVVPWGIATSYLAGGRVADMLLFGGLSLYAMAGCACQDLRVSRQEGSVGTVMDAANNNMSGTTTTINNNNNNSSQLLQDFLAETSYIPFGAVFDGRQSITTIVQESPWLAFLVGYPVGAYLESFLLNFLLQQQQ